MNTRTIGLGLVALLAACAPRPHEHLQQGGPSSAADPRPATEGRPPAEYTSQVLPLPGDPYEYGPLARYKPMPVPADNPMTPEKAELGRQLWFDTRLSGDGKLSCYSCHVNEKGLTDGKALGEGAFGKKLTRSSPTLWNIGYHTEFYWDGRAKSLEAQALAAWKGVNMGAAKPEEVVAKLNAIRGYREQFRRVFRQDATVENVPKALSAYMRTIISRDTPYDRWQRGDESAVSDAAKRGQVVFKKAKCDNCHSGFLFTDQQYHNTGVGMAAKEPDLGRYVVTKKDMDRGAFKTPTLRDISNSAPYFHDGSAATLEEAVKIMVGGGLPNPQLDTANLQKAELSPAEIGDLVEFLKALDEPYELLRPALPE
jgi:cytochrome c peroxidase